MDKPALEALICEREDHYELSPDDLAESTPEERAEVRAAHAEGCKQIRRSEAAQEAWLLALRLQLQQAPMA